MSEPKTEVRHVTARQLDPAAGREQGFDPAYAMLIGSCSNKKQYRSAGKARASLLHLKRVAPKSSELGVYRCQIGCGNWHIGSQRKYRESRDAAGGMR